MVRATSDESQTWTLVKHVGTALPNDLRSDNASNISDYFYSRKSILTIFNLQGTFELLHYRVKYL